MSQTGSTRLRLCAVAGAALCLNLAAQAGWAQTKAYAYDALGRLTSVTDTNGSMTTYSYDLAGNRTSQIISLTIPVVSNVTQIIAVGSVNNPINFAFSGAAATSVALYGPAPTQGTLSAPVGVTMTYTPTATTNVTDGFQYTASNASGTSTPATVTLTISTTASIWGHFNWTPTGSSGGKW